MKKIILLVLVLAVFALCLSCGGEVQSDTTPNGTPAVTPGETAPDETPSDTPFPEETPLETPENSDNGGMNVKEEDDTRDWGEFIPPM